MADKKVSKYPYESNATGGVKVQIVRGIFEDENWRISEHFTDADRQWRKQWFKDQILSPNEPRHVPELDLLLSNPIKRAAAIPCQYVENKMTPIFGKQFSQGFRRAFPKVIGILFVFYGAFYNLKYRQNDWTSTHGWFVYSSKPKIYPNDKDFPAKRERFHPNDYDDRGFKARTVFRDCC